MQVDRAIHAIGLYSSNHFILDIDTGLWHCAVDMDRTEAVCGKAFNEVNDETAAGVLHEARRELSSCPTCLPLGSESPPTLEPPWRIKRLLRRLERQEG